MTSIKSWNHHAIHRVLPPKASPNSMSTKTKFFIQKICYKKTASIDMTKNGFAKYATMMQPVKLLLKPLKEQLAKILNPSLQNKKSESAKCMRQRKKNSKVRGVKQQTQKPVKKKKKALRTKQIRKNPKKM